MAIRIYWGSGSPFAWRALLTLELKRLEYESKLLEFSKQQHRSAEYLRINPRGRVPALVDGDFVLYESLAIMVYLDRKHPEPPLFGRTPEEAGTIWRCLSEYQSYLHDSIDRVVRPVFTGAASENQQDIVAAAHAAHGELAQLEAALARSQWIAGAEISAADVALFPFIQVLLRAASKDIVKPLSLGFLPLHERYPRLAAWIERVERIPGYERTYPPHWK